MALRSKASPARGVEPLEPRLVLSSSSPLVGDAQFAYYDGQAYGTADPVFERAAPTYDADGVLVEAGERRFAETVAYAPPIEWTGTGVVTAPSGIVRVYASGWDHDGRTPMAVVRVEGSSLDIYRGEDLTKVGSISYDQLSEAAGENKQLRPKASVVFNGLAVIACERFEDLGNGYTSVGMTFLTTQDYGQTLVPIAQVGGGTDVPPIEGGVANGMMRGRSWSFLNAFPVDGSDDGNAAWFPWADYIDRLHKPQGGQIGLFKATRSAEGEPWIVEPNRLIFEVWEPNDPTRGYHAHAAAITTAGVVSHWGDVGYRNSERLHEFDLENYTTAPVTTTTVFGGYDENGVIYRAAPQPVATAPGVRPGEHFASGDLTREAVLRFGNLESASDRLEVDGAVDRPFSTSRGFTYAGALILHLHWQQGVGYVSSDGRAAGFAHFSPNGEDWVAFNHDEQANGRVFLYGDRLLGLAGGNELHVAPLPTIEVVEPLTLAPGGNNLIATSLENRFAPASGLAMREVNFTAGLWRYTDDGMPLDVQPAAPQFPPNTLVYEATSSSPTATALGTWWLQRAGETMDLDVPVIMESWVANLSEQSVQLLTRLRTPDRGSRFAAIRGHEVAATKDWVALDYRAVFPYDGEARAAAQFDLTKPAPGSRFLIAMPYLGVESNLPYPIAPGTSGPDESEVLPPFEATEDWTVALVAAWPENASLVGRQERTVLKLDGPRDGRAEIAVEYAGDRSLDRLLVSVYEGETLVARNTHQIRLLREEAIEVVVSGDGTTLRSTARSGSVQVSERSTTYSTALAITSVGWGGAGMESAAIEPILLCVDPHAAASSAGQRDWMHSTLRQKAVAFARNAPGDYNGDGLVNAADYTVLRDQLGTAVGVGELADGNRDGQITEADVDVWRANYGTIVPTIDDVLAVPLGNTPNSAKNAPGDYNGDGLVNAADYTVWRDRLGTSVAVGESADGSRDGEITEADFDVWQAAYGTVVPPLAEVLAAPRGDTHSAVVSLTASTGQEAYAPTGQPDPIGLGKGGSEVLASALIPNDQPTRDRESYLPPTRQPVQAFGESTQEAPLLALRAIDDTRDAAFETLTGTAETASIETIQDRDLDDDLSMRLIDWDAFTARSDTSI